MVQKLVGGKVPAYLYLNSIMLSSLFPQEDGSISGDVGANGGFCFPGAWNSPITSPTDGIGPVRLDATVMQFASLVGTRLGKSPADVLKAISGALEDVYNEQNK